MTDFKTRKKDKRVFPTSSKKEYRQDRTEVSVLSATQKKEQWSSADRKLADTVIDQSEGEESFWFSVHQKKDTADKKAAKLNRLFAGTKAEAQVELARNYNARGIPYGVAVKGFDEAAEKKMKRIVGSEYNKAVTASTWSKTKKFSSREYELKGTAYNKADAELMAESARKNGYNVRIKKRSGKRLGYGEEPQYGIYIRKSARSKNPQTDIF